jgi:uncharacterized phiE125 gp8 family phage protein
MNYGLRITTEPATEPITTATAKQHLLIASAVTAHDTFIASLVTAARKYIEDRLNRSLITTEWELILDSFPYDKLCLSLPRSPIVSVDSVTYVDGSGDTQTWSSSNYVLSESREPARLSLDYSKMWPEVRFQPDAVTIAFTAGYGTADDVPQPIKQAMLLLIGHWFEHRSEVDSGNLKSIPMAVEALIDTYRVGDEFTCYAG